MLSEEITDWAARAIGPHARCMSATPLYTWRSNPPWVLHLDDGSRPINAVLRVAPTDAPPDATQAVVRRIVAAMDLAERYRVPAPRLLAADPEGVTVGTPALLETFLPGSSTVPTEPSSARLWAFGAAIATLCAAHAVPTADLPFATTGIDIDHAAAQRRRAMRYDAATQRERAVMIEKLCEASECHPEQAIRIITEPAGGRSEFLEAADDGLASIGVPDGGTVLVHGDIWQGNTLWLDGQLTGIVDWDAARIGHPGIDLGAARLDAALSFGVDAAARVLEGWQESSSVALDAEAIAYWDARAAVNTPADVRPPNEMYGRPDLDKATVTHRRDEFLQAALETLR